VTGPSCPGRVPVTFPACQHAGHGTSEHLRETGRGTSAGQAAKTAANPQFPWDSERDKRGTATARCGTSLGQAFPRPPRIGGLRGSAGKGCLRQTKARPTCASPKDSAWSTGATPGQGYEQSTCRSTGWPVNACLSPISGRAFRQSVAESVAESQHKELRFNGLKGGSGPSTLRREVAS
jgi:hypothetical protein